MEEVQAVFPESVLGQHPRLLAEVEVLLQDIESGDADFVRPGAAGKFSRRRMDLDPAQPRGSMALPRPWLRPPAADPDTPPAPYNTVRGSGRDEDSCWDPPVQGGGGGSFPAYRLRPAGVLSLRRQTRQERTDRGRDE